jgi:DNA-directed RNA polymerase specialized sigma24 family protein
MNQQLQFKPFVKSLIRKHQATLSYLSKNELEAECWSAVATAISRWDGSKGHLSSWVYTTVTGRIKDLKKRPVFKTHNYMQVELSQMEATGNSSPSTISLLIH